MSFPRKILLVVALVLGGIVYGFFATLNHWWIADRLNDIRVAFNVVLSESKRGWFISIPPAERQVETFDGESLQPGLVLLAGVDGERHNFIRVVNRDGEVVHSWRPNWFEIWPEAPATVPQGRIPQRVPGQVLHGVQLLPDGDVLINYEFLSTIRLDACGDVVWKLPNLGHHSIDVTEDDRILVGAERSVISGPTGYQNHIAPLNAWAIQEIAMDGTIQWTKEIIEIIEENDLLGLLYLSTLDNTSTVVKGDTLHPNDVEVYPDNLPSEIFEPGDLMLSLRNINTILVVDPDDWKVKFQSTGQVLRQHDADFIGDDKILVYDNRNLDPLGPREEMHTRIVELDARTGTHRVYFKGEGPAHFYSPTMGRQQLLDNGNLMVTSPLEGRALEVSPEGDLLWQYYNILDEEYSGLITEAQVLPLFMDEQYFAGLASSCKD